MKLTRLVAAAALLFASTAYAAPSSAPAPMSATDHTVQPVHVSTDVDIDFYFDLVQGDGEHPVCNGGRGCVDCW
jgi:hypothetical protein